MAIKFHEEQVKAEVVIARELVKDVVSGDIELRGHDNGLQVNEILDVKTQVRDVKAVIADGGVEINGVLHINVVYNVEDMSEEDNANYVDTYHQAARIEFENFIDIPEAEAGMHILLNIRVADITYDVLETDALEVAITLIKYCAVSDIQDIRCVTQVHGLSREEIVEEQLRLEEWIGDESIRAAVAKEVELNDHFPLVEEVLAVVGEVVKAEYKTMENAVICDGIMEVSVLYRGEDSGLYVIDERIEFNHALDLYGVEPGMTVAANYKLNELDVQSLSENRIRILGQVECYVKVTRPHRITVVTDILNERVDTEKVTVMMEEVVGRGRVKDSIVHRVNVPPTRPDIKSILQCYSRVKDLTSIVNDGGIVVEGSLEGTAYYLSEDDYCTGDRSVCLKDYFDFDDYIHIEECEEGMDVYIEVDVKRTSWQILNDRTLEMSVLLEKMAKVTEKIEVDCVTDLVEVSPIVDDPYPPSYIVYVVQRGDTLDKIARRYKIHLDSLIEINNLDNPDLLYIGQKVLIPRSLIGATG